MLDVIEKFKYGIFNDDTLVVGNKKELSYSRYSENGLKNVEITFHKNGFIEIKADEIDSYYNLDGIGYSKYAIDEVEDDDIRTVKKYYFFGPKIKIIKNGWFSLKKTKHFKLRSNALIVIERV